MSTKISNNLGCALLDWRKQTGDSQTGMADKTGVSRNTLLAYEKGDSKPGVEFLSRFSQATGAPLNTLLSCLLSDLPGEDAQKIVHTLSGAAKKEVPKELGDLVMVPRYDVQASAGAGCLIHSELIVDHLAFRQEWVSKMGLTRQKLALIEVHGDSMEPALKNGDLVLIDLRTSGLAADGIYVVQHRGNLLVKRIQCKFDGTVVIKSDNPAYEAEVLRPSDAEELVVVGRVVWFGRGL